MKNTEQGEIAAELGQMYEKFCHSQMKSEELQLILDISQIRIYPKGEIIRCIQQPTVHTGLLLKGIVRNYFLDAEGNEITKYFSREGSFIMDEGLLGYKQSIAALEALEKSTVLLMDTVKLKQLIQVNDIFKNLYINCLESALRYKIYRESEFLTKNATERYLQFCNDFPELVNRVKQSYISTYLGITPESLSRIRKALKNHL